MNSNKNSDLVIPDSEGPEAETRDSVFVRARQWLNPTVMTWLAFLARISLVVVWGWSGVAKASNPSATKVAIRAYSLVPDSWVNLVAMALPFLEIALALLLLLGLAIRLAGVLSAVLFVGFIVGVISAAARGLSIDCGCFGGGGAVADGQTQYVVEIARDVGFLLLAGLLIYWPRTPLSIDGLVSRSQDRQA